MPKFTALEPSEVTVGRGRGAAEARKPYIEALRDSEAGKVELEKGEKPQAAKRLLQQAAKEVGKRIRSTYLDKEGALIWKIVAPR